MNSNLNNNMNSLIEDIINNNEVVNARFESLQDKIDSRAVSPSTLTAKLHAKIKVEPIDLATDTPRAYAPREDISMTAIMKNHEDTDAFAHANPMPKQRKPVESKRLICCSQPSKQPNASWNIDDRDTRSDRVSGWSIDVVEVLGVRALVTGIFPAL
jgi:hypothetical protein